MGSGAAGLSVKKNDRRGGVRYLPGPPDAGLPNPRARRCLG